MCPMIIPYILFVDIHIFFIIIFSSPIELNKTIS